MVLEVAECGTLAGRACVLAVNIVKQELSKREETLEDLNPSVESEIILHHFSKDYH